jgi:glycosyltransferase involved in cell wall biosynthesis
MACGTPVAAPAAGACADAVLDGTTGVLIPHGRPELFARRVRELLASPLRLEAFGIAAADRATAWYTWDRISLETLAAYERCLQPAAANLAGAGPG